MEIKNWTRTNPAIVDISRNTISKPFCGDEAVSDIWYTSQGYGDIITNPFTRELVTNNKPDTIKTYDTPDFLVRKKLRNGSILSRAATVNSFQIWLEEQGRGGADDTSGDPRRRQSARAGIRQA